MVWLFDFWIRIRLLVTNNVLHLVDVGRTRRSFPRGVHRRPQSLLLSISRSGSICRAYKPKHVR